MTAHSRNQERLSCSKVKSLTEKKRFDADLSSDEQRLIDAHLNQCAPCRSIATLISALPGIAAEAAERKRDATIANVMKDLRHQRAADHPRNRLWKAVAIAGAIAVLVTVGVWTLRTSSSVRPEPSPFHQCLPSQPIETTPGVFMAYCDGVGPKTIVENGQVNVLLRRGSVALFVDPERRVKKMVTVETAHGQVQVKGTLFAVRVDDDNAWVEVFQGVVEVIPEGDEDLFFPVAAGYGADLRQRQAFRLADKVTDRLVQALRPEPSEAPVHEIAGPLAAQNSVTDEITVREPDGGEIFADEAQVERSELLEKEMLSSISEDQGPHVALSIKRLLGEARACLLVRDWMCAASRYQEVIKLNSRRPGLTTVLVTLAKIELRHLDRPKKALTHYKSYLRQAPKGPLAQEALWGMAASYRRLGFEDRETATLRRFIEAFPGSNLADNARIRLERLGESSSR